MSRFKITLSVVSALALIGLASLAFAHGPGYGRYGRMMDGDDGNYGHMMGYGGGYGGPMMGNGGGWNGHMMGNGYNNYGNISREDAAKLDRARNDFYESTRSLRGDIRDKQLALDSALREKNPDPKTVANIQKALSKLQSDFDQKALAYRLEIAKIQPEGDADGGYGYAPCWNR